MHCINELLANEVLLISKILLGYEKTLRPKILEIIHASQILTNERQILVLSLLSNYYCNIDEETILISDQSCTLF